MGRDEKVLPLVLAAAGVVAFGGDVMAHDFRGPGRFCGYSAIIDLLPNETIETLDGGMHGGSVRWTGAFGSLEISNIGWASKPDGTIVGRTASGQMIFSERRVPRQWIIAIWNGRQGATYFRSADRFTTEQRKAIERVGLFQEGEKPPEGCRFRTVFVWE